MIFFLQRVQTKRKKLFLGGGRGGGGEGGRSRWTDRLTGPNQFALSTSAKLGA